MKMEIRGQTANWITAWGLENRQMGGGILSSVGIYDGGWGTERRSHVRRFAG